MTRVTITGAAGRMGRTLVGMVLSDPGFALAGATEQAGHPALGADAGVLAGTEACGVHLTASLDEALAETDAIIDFTAVPATLAHAGAAVRHRAGMVVGTTGFTDAEASRLDTVAERVPVVRSGNMSVGINLLQALVRRAAAVLGPEYDVEIIEAHHRHKKDAPSGTAAMLADAAADGHGTAMADKGVYGRHGMPGERPQGEIGVHAVRAGDIIGEHTVLFGGPGERLELVHKAHTRDIFARGALRAAAFVKNAEPGRYDMRDVLELNG